MSDDDFLDDYDDWEDEPCDHDDYDVDLLAGRACCYRCGEAWWLTDAQLRLGAKLAAEMFLAEEVIPSPPEPRS